MRTRRHTELLLLLAAAPVVLLVFGLVNARAAATIGFADLAVPAGLVAAFLGAHLAVRLLAPAADPVLLPLAALLSGIGLAFVTRLDPELGSRQLVWLLVSIGAMVATLAAVRSLERASRFKYTIMLVALALLVLPTLIGVEVNGARLWLRFAGLSFQPGEVAKVLIVVFLAAYLAEKREVLSISTRRVLGAGVPALRHLGPLVFMWAISLFVLVTQKDLGSSLLFFGLFLVMIFVATGRLAYVMVGLGLFAAGAAVAYQLFGHVQSRVAIWIDPFADPTGRGYQLVQSLFALAAGQMTGVGVGRGLPERIPFVETDFIFTSIAEELGLLGGAALIIAYLLFCMRGLATAARARSDMAAFTAAGLVAAFGLQTFVIIGGVTRLIPLTGITLPFVSYGGSSMLANFMLLGLLLRAGDAGTGRAAEIITLASDGGALGRVALARRLAGVATLIGVLLAALVVNLTYLQVVVARDLDSHPANTRGLASEIRSPRGSIVTADAVVLADSVANGELYARRYPQGSLAAHVVGYHTLTYGRAGIESSMNGALTGQRVFRTFRDAVDAAAGLPVAGNDIWLTIDSRVQQAAEQALAGRRGSVVALDPRTGAVLAMASVPAYDPNTIDAEWDALSSAEGSPLFDRSIQGLYPPGSTYKIVTLTGALAANTVSAQTTYTAPGRLEIGGAPVTNYEGGEYGVTDVRTATMRSINTVFAQIAVDMGARELVSASERFGVGKTPPLEIEARASLMPVPGEMTTWETAWAGVGQPVGEHESPPGPQTTPLQMALVAAGIANDGNVMRPHLVQRVTDWAGRVITTTEPRRWTTAADPAVAATVRDIMVASVESGTGTRARIPGVAVAGKTGTAQAGRTVESHAWFIGFAPANDPQVAVAVIVEKAGPGGRIAAPVARSVIEAALAR
ncbi:MAG: FtsW/RodA/SpoVE family cell cycle protein [Clostridiales bacterium]|nr:FtsW/RodA/SpoVE family cell cycle protein [Clostridiales bacterium]